MGGSQGLPIPGALNKTPRPPGLQAALVHSELGQWLGVVILVLREPNSSRLHNGLRNGLDAPP